VFNISDDSLERWGDDGHLEHRFVKVVLYTDQLEEMPSLFENDIVHLTGVKVRVRLRCPSTQHGPVWLSRTKPLPHTMPGQARSALE
jgi:hypothetical protein